MTAARAAGSPLNRALVCPALIGRDTQLAAIERALGGAQQGHGQTILIGGEAGLGKSRLVSEAQRRAEGRGILSLIGQCFEPDLALPYAPLLDLLRARFAGRAASAVAQEVGAAAPVLVALLPELATALGTAPTGLSPATATPDPEQEQRRLIRSLAEFFTRLAATRPILLAIEDLHWCDDNSLDLLLHLARQIAHQPIVLLLTYRPDETHPGLRHFLAEIDRGRLATDLLLVPLGRGNVEAMLRAIFALERPVRAAFLEAIHTLTEGNPFFIEEVLTSLAATGDLDPAVATWDHHPLDTVRIPRSVQDAVLRRLIRVSPPAQRVLTLAAVAGRRFDFSLLRELADQDEIALLACVKELVAAQLVVEESADIFAFRHALTRQAIYAQLLVRERQAVHHTIAETLERRFANSTEAVLPDLAYHCYAAGAWERAQEYTRRMGERAQAMRAPQAAIEHFSHAIESSRHLGLPPAPALHRARGRAYEMRGEFEHARNDYEQALGAARASGDSGGEWQGLLDLGFLWQGRDYRQTGNYFRQALLLAERLADPQRHAQSLNRLGNWYVNLNQPQQGQEFHRQALTIFEASADRPGIAETLDLLGLATYFRGDRRGALSYYEAAGTHLRTLDDRRGLASTLAALAHLRCASRIYDIMPGASQSAEQALREGEEAVTLAREIGWRSGEAYALGEWANCLVAAGEYGRALAAAQQGLAIAEEIEHQHWQAIAHGTLATIYLDLLNAPAACQHAERSYALARDTGSSFSINVSGAILIMAALLGREPTRAEAILQDLVTPETTIETLAQGVLLAAQGEFSLAHGDPRQALAIADQLIAWAESVGGPGIGPRPAVLRGEALAALGQADAAESALHAARDIARKQGAHLLLWRVELTLGAALQVNNDREGATQAYAAAQTIVEEVAVSLPDEALRGLFQAQASAHYRAPQPLPARRGTIGRNGNLTAREREVVALIAHGRSNREIADTLFVSERTVEAHTSHIRDKLGLTSRTQVAAWAVEHGLTRASD